MLQRPGCAEEAWKGPAELGRLQDLKLSAEVRGGPWLAGCWCGLQPGACGQRDAALAGATANRQWGCSQPGLTHGAAEHRLCPVPFARTVCLIPSVQFLPGPMYLQLDIQHELGLHYQLFPSALL